ncbi:MAG: hypothetical protein K8J08_14110 [Thermoanaerobaculia bacterium]|nr:hypothetical protein [Thermoanaerobaculia bacterium]
MGATLGQRSGISIAVLLVCLLWPHETVAQWPAAGTRGASESLPQKVGDFGAMLLFTRHHEALLEAWNHESSPEYQPEIRTTSSVARNEALTAVLLFMGCQPDEEGHCNADVSFVILDPAGDEYGRLPPAELWVDKPAPPEPAVQLGVNYLQIVIEDGELLGGYEIQATLCDRNADVCLDLSDTFDVKEPSEILDMDELWKSYFLDPRPALVGAAVLELCSAGDRDQGDVGSPTIGFLAGVLMTEAEPLPNWPEQQLADHPVCRDRVERARALASDFTATYKTLEVNPSLNDLLWGLYFATGEELYLREISRHLRFVTERENLQKFLTGGSASWSLASNARQHERVRDQLREMAAATEGEDAQALQNVLDTHPESIGVWMQEVLQENRANGVW